MESLDAAERKWACVAVSNLIQNDPSTRRLLQGKNIVGALITRLSDSEEEVVIEAAGALRLVVLSLIFFRSYLHGYIQKSMYRWWLRYLRRNVQQTHHVSPYDIHPEGARSCVYDV